MKRMKTHFRIWDTENFGNYKGSDYISIRERGTNFPLIELMNNGNREFSDWTGNSLLHINGLQSWELDHIPNEIKDEYWEILDQGYEEILDNLHPRH